MPAATGAAAKPVAALLACVAVRCVAADAGIPPDQIRVTPLVAITGDWLASRGGLRDGNVFLAKPEMRFTFEDYLHRMVVVDAGAINGQSITQLVGDEQGTSNLEGPRAGRIFDLFYQTPLARSQSTVVRAGIIDLNGYFYVQGDAAAIFVNSSHGIGPEFSHTGVNGPSIYPNMGLAAMVEHTTGDNHALRFGAFDAAPNDPEHPSRMELHLPGQKGALLIGEWVAGQARVGAWGYTNVLEQRNGDGPAHGNRGAYTNLQFQPTQSVAGWVTAGASRAAFNVMDSYLGGGLVKTLGRNSIGFAIASAGFSAGGPRETTLEVTAPIDLGHGFAVQPDLQRVLHPSGASGSAWVAGVRLRYSYDGSESPRPILLRRGGMRPRP